MRLSFVAFLLLLTTQSFASTSTAPVTIDQSTPGTSNGVVVNSGSVTATQSGTWNLGLNAGTNLVGKFGIDQTTPGTTNGVVINSGTTTVTQPTGSNLHVQADASTAVIGHVIVDSGNITTGAVSASTRADTFTSATSGTTVDVHLAPLKSFSLAVKATGAVTSWTVVLECSLDNTNFTTVLTHTNATPGDGQIIAAGTNLFPCMYFRSRATAITLGSGTNVIATILAL